MKKFQNNFLKHNFIFQVGKGPKEIEAGDPAKSEKPDKDPEVTGTQERGKLADEPANDATSATAATKIPAKSPDKPATIPENDDLPKSSHLHTKFIKYHDLEFNKDGKSPEKVNQIIEQDIKTLSATEIADIRYGSRLLVPKKGQESDPDQISNLKQETARRLRAYCDTVDEEWYTLNYQKVGGNKHEYGIGLGDVLLDPDIQNILVKKSGGETVKAHRGVVPSGQSHSGRVGFLDENNKYVATFTGDKFRILSNEGAKNGEAAPEQEVDSKKPESVKTYISKYQEEENVRAKHKQIYHLKEEADLNISIDEKKYGKFNPTTDEQAISKLNSHREEKDGEKILIYAKKVCEKFKIPFSIMKELIGVETGYSWKPTSFNKSSGASGLGQFLDGTWNGFIKFCNENRVNEEEWGNETLTLDSRFNPYIMLYATARLMSLTKKAFPGFEQKPFEEQAILYYLAHHEGVGGAKTYLAQLESGNIPTRPFVIDLSKRIATLAARSDGIKLTKNRVYALIDDGKEQYNGKGLIDLKGGQKTWIFGSSSVLNGKFKGKPEIGRFGVIGDNPQSFYARLQNYWPEIEPFIKEPGQKPKQIILMGLGANTPSTAMTGYLQIVKFLKDKGITNVKIGTVQEINPETAKLNEEIRKTDNYIDFATNTKGMTSGIHFSQEGYNVIHNMIQESASQIA